MSGEVAATAEGTADSSTSLASGVATGTAEGTTGIPAAGTEGSATGTEGVASLASTVAQGEGTEGTEGAEGTKEPLVYDLKLPEGMAADDPAITAFKDFAAEAGIQPEAAQKLLDMHTETLQKVANAPYEGWAKTQNEWRAEISADPEIGGAKLPQNLASITKLIDGMEPAQAQQFRQALDFTGAGNNPAIIRGLISIAKMHSEGGHIDGGVPLQPKSAASRLYPTLNSGG